jgi:hypothetical protein
MATIKKKDFKKQVAEVKSIEEFVNDDGGIISGDEKFNKGSDVKTGPINTDPEDIKGVAVDTDKHRASAIQPRNWWWSLSYGYGQGRGKSPIGSNIGYHGDGELGESIDESELTAEQKMRNMVEKFLTKRSSSTDLVKKNSNGDINRNDIPDIEELEDTKMIVVGKVKDLIDSITSANLNGEEIGMIVNYMITNMDTAAIPSDYKNIIKTQL